MSFLHRVASIFALVIIAGCGGGSASMPPSGGAPTANTTMMPMTFLIQRGTQAQAKHPQFISPATQSFAIYVYAQGGTQPATPTSTLNVSSCSGTTTLTCNTSVPSPIGSVTLTVASYTAANAAGALLATVTTNLTVTAGMQPVSITLQGTPAIIKLSLETPVLLSGTAGTSKLDVNAYDASGNLIVAPGNFASPITISSDSTAVSLSGTSASGPGTQLTLTYGGGAAPYAVHLSGSGAGVATTSIIGATLVVTPPNSFIVFGNNYNNFQMLQVGIGQGGLEPPQNVTFLGGISNESQLAYGYAAGGTVGIAGYDYSTSKCVLASYPASNLALQTTLSYAGPSDSPSSCAATGEPNGDLLVGDGLASNDITEYSVGTGGAAVTGRSISLMGAQVPTASVAPVALATNASGQIAVLAQSGSNYYALVYAAGASGAATPTQTISLTGAAGNPAMIAIASDGTVAVAYNLYSPSCCSYRIDRYSASGTLAGSIAPTANASFPSDFFDGMTFDSGNNIYVLDTLYGNSPSIYNYEINIELFPSGQYGTLTPTSSQPLAQTAGLAQGGGGPFIVSSPAPPATIPAAVTGDMMAYAPSRTWTYLVTSGSAAPYYIGIYADPTLVNGNERLVGFQSATSNPFSGGTKIGTLDFAQTNGTYFAEAFDSPSSGTSGISGPVPGTPMWVPNSLSLNSTWSPLQNITFAPLTGVTARAQVTFVGAVPGIGACPAGSGTAGATVNYSVTQSIVNYNDNSFVSFVPGCGITSITTEDGSTIVLQSVGSNSSLGQQTIPAGQPSIVQALHALWRATFGVPKPH